MKVAADRMVLVSDAESGLDAERVCQCDRMVLVSDAKSGLHAERVCQQETDDGGCAQKPRRTGKTQEVSMRTVDTACVGFCFQSHKDFQKVSDR